MPVASDAKGPAAAQHPASTTSTVELGRHARSHPHALYVECREQGRAGSEPDRRHHRQPEREERRKRGVCIDPPGYDAGKQIKGKKRHILVDTQGLLLHAIVIPPISRIATAASRYSRPVRHISILAGAVRRRRLSRAEFPRRLGRLLPDLKRSRQAIRSVEKGSWSCPSAGSSSARSPGSTAAEGWPRTGRTSTEARSHSCGSPQSASCSEGSAIPPDVSGQTLSAKYLTC